MLPLNQLRDFKIGGIILKVLLTLESLEQTRSSPLRDPILKKSRDNNISTNKLVHRKKLKLRTNYIKSTARVEPHKYSRSPKRLNFNTLK